MVEFVNNHSEKIGVIVRYGLEITDKNIPIGQDNELAAALFAIKRQKVITAEIDKFKGPSKQGEWLPSIRNFRDDELNRECQAYVEAEAN